MVRKDGKGGPGDMWNGFSLRSTKKRPSLQSEMDKAQENELKVAARLPNKGIDPKTSEYSPSAVKTLRPPGNKIDKLRDEDYAVIMSAHHRAGLMDTMKRNTATADAANKKLKRLSGVRGIVKALAYPLTRDKDINPTNN